MEWIKLWTCEKGEKFEWINNICSEINLENFMIYGDRKIRVI